MSIKIQRRPQGRKTRGAQKTMAELTRAFSKTLPSGNMTLATIRTGSSDNPLREGYVTTFFDIFDPKGEPYHDDWMREAPEDLMQEIAGSFHTVHDAFPDSGGEASVGRLCMGLQGGSAEKRIDFISAILKHDRGFNAVAEDSRFLDMRRRDAYTSAERREIEQIEYRCAEEARKKVADERAVLRAAKGTGRHIAL